MGLFDIITGKSKEQILDDWENEPATERQIAYILSLGGNPPDWLTKSKASDMIDELQAQGPGQSKEYFEVPAWAILPDNIELPYVEIPEGKKDDIWAFKKMNPFTTPNGAVFCLSGDFDISKEVLNQIICTHGGKVVDDVTQKVDFLHVGSKDPSKCFSGKAMKARNQMEKGSSIRIIGDVQFQRLIEESVRKLAVPCPYCYRLISQSSILKGLRSCHHCKKTFSID